MTVCSGLGWNPAFGRPLPGRVWFKRAVSVEFGGFRIGVRSVTIRRRPSFNPKPFLAKIGGGRSVDRYHSGDIVFSQRDPANAVFYIQKGNVKVAVVSERGKAAVVAILGANEFFGEGCLDGRTQRRTTVTTITDAVIMRLEKADMVRMIHQEPTFCKVFIGHLLHRAGRLEADLADQLVSSSEKRLARLLLLLADPDKNGKSKPTIPKISQGTLAAMVGTTRSRVSYFMNKFRDLGLIDYSGGVSDRIEVHGSLSNSVLPDKLQTKTRIR
jgi:CRP/FNR family transcriptional regulator, cyclic AMP receptor protein